MSPQIPTAPERACRDERGELRAKYPSCRRGIERQDLGAYRYAVLGFELFGDRVQRPEGVDGEDGGIAVALEFRFFRPLGHRSRRDCGEHGENADSVLHFHSYRLLARRESFSRTG